MCGGVVALTPSMNRNWAHKCKPCANKYQKARLAKKRAEMVSQDNYFDYYVEPKPRKSANRLQDGVDNWRGYIEGWDSIVERREV